jgi:hypothetical protein
MTSARQSPDAKRRGGVNEHSVHIASLRTLKGDLRAIERWHDARGLAGGEWGLPYALCPQTRQGRAGASTSLTFVSKAAIEKGLGAKWGLAKELVAVENVRSGIGKRSMVHNDATPNISVDPETYEVRADGELLVCEPAMELPMAQRYFLF